MKSGRASNAHAVLRAAHRGRYAIGAFNVGSLEVLQAILRAAQKLRSPVIIETSPGETDWIGADVLHAMLEAFRQRLRIPIFANLDHATAVPAVRRAIAAGYHMVHFDGSKLPRATNIRQLRGVVSEAHRQGILVEGEQDHITGSSEWHRGVAVKRRQPKNLYTDADLAHNFVTRTRVDIFAPFVGNVHGVYADKERLDLPRLQLLSRRLPCFLSLHGGSGIRASDVRGAIRSGIVKVNVNTELRMAYVQSLRRVLRSSSNEIAPYKFMPPVIAAVQKVVEEKIRLFGSAGKA